MEDRISELKDRTMDCIEAEDQKEERLKKSEQSLGRLWDAISRSSLWGSQKEEREKGQEKI